MATEVSCGQCHGRLLVETLGVVVACPHCGTHLSIPAPASPEPPAPVAAPPEPEPVPAPVPVFSEMAPSPVDPPIHLPTTEVDSPNVHAGTDDTTIDPNEIGWNSTPNLHLAPGSAPSSSGDSAPKQIFKAPLTELGLPSIAPATAPVEPVPAPPVWAPEPSAEPVVVAAATPSPAPLEFQLSSTQQFSLGALAHEAAKSAPEPATMFVPPQPLPEFIDVPATTTPSDAPTFGAAPAMPPLTFGASPTAPASPITFGAAPVATAPVPMTFGAAPAAPLPPSTPLTFGAAPVTTASSPRVPAQPSSPATTVAPTSTVAEEAAAFAENELVSRQKFLMMLLIIVASYASAVTIVLLYMLIRGRTSDLESLPDLKPAVAKNGEMKWTYNPPQNEVPWGHSLSLGQSRRFGSVKVTPLKVTRGPIKFEHFSGQANLNREPSPPVLKLWVKFENVSRNQTFAPVDPFVLFTRNSINLGQVIQANGFVTTETGRKKGKPLSYIFDMPVHSEFTMVGQNLNRELSPKESLETFIPAEEDAGSLKGNLVWRFQFRKGYNPASKRGVTTLIDVRFNSNDVTDERGA